jgi:phosphate transport system protein
VVAAVNGRHILSEFDRLLARLEEALRLMFGLVRQQFADLSEIGTDVQIVLLRDDEIDALEKEIDEMSLVIMQRFQPCGADLRLVISAMKAAMELERVGDHAVTVARREQVIGPIDLTAEETLFDVRQMCGLYQQLLTRAEDALCLSDWSAAIALRQRCHQLGREHDEIEDRIAEGLQRQGVDPKAFAQAMIAHAFRRATQRIASIAEIAVWRSRAEDIRHVASGEVISNR